MLNYAVRMLHNLAIIFGVFNTILIPIQFKDRELQCTQEQIGTLAGQCSEYFDRQYRGEKTFSYQVCDPVTLPENLEYYGADGVSRKDELFYKAVVTACREIDSKTDFSEADAILFLAAGPSEDEGNGEEFIWPHMGRLSDQGAALRLDGEKIDDYIVCTELSYGEFTGPGKICHETGHLLGFPDLYDTDGEGSQGTAEAMDGKISLMAEGYKNGGGFNPPDFTAIEREIAGTGKCIPMKPGTYELTPGWEYLKLEGEQDGEYYLVEYLEDRGLVRWHIDKSSNSAGISSMQGKVITAAQRWELNEVNCNPGYMCACLSDNLSFRRGGSQPLHISGNPQDGFTVSEALSLSQMDIYQDGACVEFNLTEDVIFRSEPRVEWICGTDTLTAPLEHEGNLYRSLIEKGLKPSSSCRAKISVTSLDGSVVSLERDFQTRYYREDSIPFIMLRASDRNSDGSLKSGAVFPLKVYNAPGALGIIWYFDGIAVNAGWFKADKSGDLKAEVILEDGSSVFIMKELTVQ